MSLRTLVFAILAIALSFGLAPAASAASGTQPSLYERYVHRIDDKPKVQPRTYSQIPQGRKAEEFYTCGDQYCGDDDVCCTNQTDWSSYCCPNGYRCDAYGGCW